MAKNKKEKRTTRREAKQQNRGDEISSTKEFLKISNQIDKIWYAQESQELNPDLPIVKEQLRLLLAQLGAPLAHLYAAGALGRELVERELDKFEGDKKSRAEVLNGEFRVYAPLDLACCLGNKEAVGYLLAAGADPNWLREKPKFKLQKNAYLSG